MPPEKGQILKDNATMDIGCRLMFLDKTHKAVNNIFIQYEVICLIFLVSRIYKQKLREQTSSGLPPHPSISMKDVTVNSQ